MKASGIVLLLLLVRLRFPRRDLAGCSKTSQEVIPGRSTDLGFTRDRRSTARKSAKADLRGANPESRGTVRGCFWIPGSPTQTRLRRLHKCACLRRPAMTRTNLFGIVLQPPGNQQLHDFIGPSIDAQYA